MTYLLALDQGTSSSRSIVFDERGHIVAQAQLELPQIYPQPGWVEHDPLEIWRTQLATARDALTKAGISASAVRAVGITNQRETTVLWNRKTGQPVHHAIVWQDRRAEPACAQLREQGHAATIQAKTGLPVDAYALDRLISGEFQTQKRMMLCGRIIHGGEIQNISPALNDITITRCGSLQIIRLKIYVNQQFLCKLSADGMIVATPTGSTGYNMSAGGPIVEPGADLIVMTPICAHTLNARSIVLKAEDEIAIVIEQGRDGTSLMVEANSDGNEKITMVTGDKILINKSINTTTIIKLNQVSFLETLHKKMSDE